MNIKIINIHNDPNGKDTKEKLNDEYIVIKNNGDSSIDISSWKLTDYRPGQQNIHIYFFPSNTSNTTNLILEPNELVFVMTGTGTNNYISTPSEGKLPQYHLYQNKDWFIWNNDGDTACLYDANGDLVSQKTI